MQWRQSIFLKMLKDYLQIPMKEWSKQSKMVIVGMFIKIKLGKAFFQNDLV